MQQSFSCPKCGSQNNPDYQFCGQCGEKLQYTCPNCGGIVDLVSRFCPNCGVGLGWGMRLRDIQAQLARTEEELRSMVTQYSTDIRSHTARTEEGLERIITQYSGDVKSQHALLNQAVSSLSKLVAEERRRPVSESLSKSGLGVVGLGLAVIGLSYTLVNLPHLAIIGISVVALGFLLQLVSNFMRV
jgi:hypothetical protein